MHAKQFNFEYWILILCTWHCTRAVASNKTQYISVEKSQQENIEILTETLPQGWKVFCNSPVDESVMSLYNGINPSDVTVHLMTITNQSVELPIKTLSEIRDFDINPKRKTLLYLNGFYTPDTFFSIQSHLKLLQTTRRDLNIILVDFARDVAQLYFTVRHHVPLQGYFVSKILEVLVENGIKPEDITLAGHSVGAQIAALAAKLYEKQSGGVKIGQLVAIDPALMCRSADIHVASNVSSRVVVVHGEGDEFGQRSSLGSVDIYPNGIGFFPKKKLQPGCESNLCSHMYSFVLFMEALIEGVMIPAVKCDSWAAFRKHSCDFENTVAIGLKYPERAAGNYFCLTQPHPPFTFMEHGLKYKRKLAKAI